MHQTFDNRIKQYLFCCCRNELGHFLGRSCDPNRQSSSRLRRGQASGDSAGRRCATGSKSHHLNLKISSFTDPPSSSGYGSTPTDILSPNIEIPMLCLLRNSVSHPAFQFYNMVCRVYKCRSTSIIFRNSRWTCNVVYVIEFHIRFP